MEVERSTGSASAGSLVIFCFGVCEDVRFQVGRLGKFFVAAVKGADVRAVSSVNAHVRAQVKVQGETFAAAFKRALKRKRKNDHLWLLGSRMTHL